MIDQYEYIHKASNARLAELLECEIGIRYAMEPQDKEIVKEAVRRLRIPRYPISNSKLNDNEIFFA